jgi:release factor glutamine methyltransferase
VTPTVHQTLRSAADALGAAGVPEPRADAEVLLAHALRSTRTGLVARANEVLPAAARDSFRTLVARRATRVPVAHLTGTREFWSLDLEVNAHVLVPRPETELLVEVTRRLAPGAEAVLDCGTGSGAVAAALAAELPRARVVATDRSRAALGVARRNLTRLAPGVVLACGDWLSMLRPDSFDVVVANPPYVPDDVIPTLDPEVCEYEPPLALAGGADGLDALRSLVAQAPDVLRPRGWLVLEMGIGQSVAMAEAVRRRDAYDATQVVPDAAGIERVLAARRR